jgi:hypothetical protein
VCVSHETAHAQKCDPSDENGCSKNTKISLFSGVSKSSFDYRHLIGRLVVIVYYLTICIISNAKDEEVSL